jgi:hypothetical protein
MVILTTIPEGPLALNRANIRTLSILLAISALVVVAVTSLELWRGERLGRLSWLLVLTWVVASTSVTIVADSQPWIDVWQLHRDAADAIRAGVTPYSGRSVPNLMPWFPNGSTFEGYVYPPVVLLAYASADLAFGDSRWIAVLVGAGLTYCVHRISSNATTDAVALLLLLAPSWPLMTQLSWTETISVCLLAFALAAKDSVRPFLLGAFIASKQYLLLLAVPAASAWLGRRNRVLVLTGTWAAVLYAVGALGGISGYVESVFVFHINTPPSDLGVSLPGLLSLLFDIYVVIPRVISLSLAVVVAFFLARKEPRTVGSMVLAATMSLALFFFLSSQSFPNYWYLILGGLVLSQLSLSEEVTWHSSPDVESLQAD